MGLIVQKFGGTSVANADRIRNVAQIIADTYRQGNQVVAVLSAQGDTTDDLIEKAKEINPNASKREMDMLLSTGEQISCALCAMAIETMGLPVVSLTGWQAGFQTNSSYSSARIKKINAERVQSELDRSHSIVIVTGFQGINKYGDITTMLQFLQCKTFGNQAVPAGWVIVAAGNPPEYNKSVRDFDIVTLDRVRRMNIEPDLPVWKDYARAAHLHSAILSYLELHPQNFYQINADVDGTQFVTARGWEDLSNLLNTYESLGLQADEELIRQYIQHQKIAEDFAAYLDLYYKYRDDYGVEDILAGKAKPAAFARLLQAPFDEKLSLVSLILSGLETRFAASRRADAVADGCYAFLKETKKAFAGMPAELAQEPNCWAQLFGQMTADYEAETQKKRTAGLLDKPTLEARLQTAKTLRGWEKTLLRAAAPDADTAFKVLREQFGTLSEARDTAQQGASAALEAAFDFMEQAFAESQEMVVFVTELTLSPAAHAFIAENGCERYFQYNKDLLLDHRKAALNQELEAEQRRHGML